MVEVNYNKALEEAKILADYSDDALFEELGLRIQDMRNIGGYSRSQQFSAEFSQDAEDMLSMDDIKKIGRLWWKKLEPELMNIICENKNEDLGKITKGKTIPQIAASLATAGIVAAFAPPAWIIVAATILATKVTETGLAALCETWRASLDN